MKQSNRQKKAIEHLQRIDAANVFYFNAATGAAKFIRGRLSEASDNEPESIARAFLEDCAGLLDLQQGLTESLAVSQIETDRQGFTHISFAQSLNGIPVFEGSTQVHINARGVVVAYKDNRIAALDIVTDPELEAKLAIATAIRDSAKERRQISESRAMLTIFRDDRKKAHLAWQVTWLVKGDMGSRFHMIDAHSGDVLFRYTHMRGIAARQTYSADNTANLKARLLLTNNQSSADVVAQAAHKHAKMVYDYYLNTFGRDSYDGLGARLVSTVHFQQDYNNAYWSPRDQQMVYGDGDGIQFSPLSLALDVVGHELTHAVTSRTARFVYAGQSGALDESFADFFGVMVSNDGDITDWKMGEGVTTPLKSGDALRDLSDPAKYNQPDHMDSFMSLAAGELPHWKKNDSGYVHTNSGIPNKAAFLTVAGGVHHGITVVGMGREKAEQIYYLALTSYLSSATDSRWTFKQARYALLNACEQLYGDAGDEYATVKNAWAGVGVGEPDAAFAVVHKDTSPALSIPDNDAAGISSVLNVEEDGLIQDIYVGIDIEHSYIGDLRVILTSPAGESVVLHDRSGGSSQNILETYNLQSHPLLNTFVGDQAQGDWALAVSDHARLDAGVLQYWELLLSLQKSEKKELAKQAEPELQIPDNNSAGIASVMSVEVSGELVRLDVSVDISHTWIGDLRVLLVSPSGAEILLHDRTGKSRNDIRKTFSTSSHAAMSLLVGESVQGDWQLQVADAAARDVGVLHAWSFALTYR